MIRIGLDTNILAYLAGVQRTADDEEKIARTRTIIRRLAAGATLIAPAQALGELFVVLRRSGASPEDARAILIEFAGAFGTSASEDRTALAAADLAVDHKLQFWDALILTAAADAGCALLLSEDMQHGFVTRGLTVVNPLADKPHPRLAALVDEAR
ncbi:Predicted nucleic acid-binding protein, contains PIN domain [Sphingomonas sp. YR710]|uniref:PIN domain-containing protein n=1 Tax=Sphingomonas sp. YR710 TaxID=1882773 RepID=UPI0008905F53|nr:PIN domain-containing protein [Sphingomonas sp. YR710]SDC93674.1 Predicted nucleic acid-binding protein, contains PIN domain [Sphingomonas sp. YR710]